MRLLNIKPGVVISMENGNPGMPKTVEIKQEDNKTGELVIVSNHVTG